MKKVLNVGQCAFDNGNISRMLESNFDVKVETAETHDDALRKAKESPYDLVLLNRIYDATGSEGIETLNALKTNTSTQGLPVMLVSNYQEAQETAVAAGAVEGFGKSELNDSKTVERLQQFLADS